VILDLFSFFLWYLVSLVANEQSTLGWELPLPFNRHSPYFFYQFFKLNIKRNMECERVTEIFGYSWAKLSTANVYVQ